MGWRSPLPLVRRGIGLTVCTVSVALASAAPALAHRPSARVLRGAGVGLRVLELTAPANARSAVIHWGDGTKTVVSRQCGRSRVRPAVMYAPHSYRSPGSFNVSAALATVGCARPQAARSATLRERVRIARAPRAAALASVAAPAQQWTTFDQSGPPLSASTLAVASGTPLAGGGCQLTPPELVLPATLSRIDGREDAIDYSTCQYLWESGAPAGAATAVQAHAAQYTVWESQVESQAASQDQINGNLNWIGITLRWRYNGGCTTSLQGEYGFPVAGVSWHTANFNNWSGQDCAHAIGFTNAIFEDTHFCPNAVYNIFNKDNLAGHANGTAAYDVNWSVPPNCAIEHLHVQSWWDYRGLFIHH